MFFKQTQNIVLYWGGHILLILQTLHQQVALSSQVLVLLMHVEKENPLQEMHQCNLTHNVSNLHVTLNLS